MRGLTYAVRRLLRAVDPGFRSEGVLSFRLSLTGERYQERADRSLFVEGYDATDGRDRILMTLLNLLGAIALILATVGLYGMLSFSVATQTQEIGIRKALGAGPGDLYRHVLRGAGAVTLGGIVLVIAVALAASLLPARRAARVDPIVALRAE